MTGFAEYYLQEGSSDEKLASAQRMIAAGQLDNQQIAMYTELPEKQIEELRAKSAK